MNQIKNHPYDEIFLDNQMELHRYVFHQFLNNKSSDFYNIVDTYLQTSELRAKLDVGNLMALNTGGKGPLTSINICKCNKKEADYVEPELTVVHWMANVYTMTQWLYNIPSKEMSKALPAKTLVSLYGKHCENSLKGTCKALYKEYLSNIKTFDELKAEEIAQEDKEGDL